MSAAQPAQHLARQTRSQKRQRVAGLEFQILVRLVTQAVEQDLAIVLQALKGQGSARLGSVHDPSGVGQATHVPDRVEKLLRRVVRGLAFDLTLAHRPSASRYFSASSAAMHPLPALVTA